MGVKLLQEDAGSAMVRASADQLQHLTCLHFQLHHIDELQVLAEAHTADKPWLAGSLEPIFKTDPDRATNTSALLSTISDEQLSALAALPVPSAAECQRLCASTSNAP